MFLQIDDTDLQPTAPLYLVTDYEYGRQGVLDDFGGKMVYGEQDWELISDGLHPTIERELLRITIH